jgi:iron(III) transport system permease protein
MAALAVPLRMTLGGVLEHLFSRVDNFDSQALWQSSFNTIKWSGWAAALGTLCALPISLLVVRWAGRLSLIIERSIWLAHALPGVIMALSLVYVSAKWLHPLYQSSLLLVLGYVVMYLPLAVGAQQVGIAQASVQLEEVSRSLGRGPLSTFGRVTMPLSLPAIGIGALLVALDAAKELTTTLLLRPTGEHTLATRLWVTTEGEVLDFISAAPYGLALLIIGAVPAFLLARATLKRL